MKKDELFDLVVVLTTKNKALEEEIKSLERQLDVAIKMINSYNNDHNEDYDEDVEDLIMPESVQKAMDEYDYEAACLQTEIEEAREEADVQADRQSEFDSQLQN